MTKKKFWRVRNIILIALGVLILGGIVSWVAFGKKGPTLVTATVTRGDVVSEVSATGKVVPVRTIELAFERGGRISGVYASVGSKVAKGDRLMELENGDLRAQLAQAQATVRSQEARLNELLAGTRPEQITIKETEVTKAKQDLQNLYGGVKDIDSDAFAKSDDAVRSKIADLFTNADTPNPKLTFQTTNSQAEIDVIALRVRVGTELSAWRTELAALPYDAPAETLLLALESARMRTGIVNDLLTRALDAVDGSLTLSDSVKTTYKTNISTARTNVNAVRSSITSQLQAISSQKTTVGRVENELALLKAGSTKEQLDAQRAQVDQARASASYASSQLEKTILRAPFAGTVTKVGFNPGDIIAANQTVASAIGAGAFQIEVNIAESDITKIQKGDVAKVTLDAYGKDVPFTATIVDIDLSETILEGVATYKTTLQFDTEDKRVLSGLTANVDILSEKKENVLYIPSRNISTIGTKKTVLLLVDAKTGETEEREITIGLRGSDGSTEVLSGLAEGDIIVSE